MKKDIHLFIQLPQMFLMFRNLGLQVRQLLHVLLTHVEVLVGLFTFAEGVAVMDVSQSINQSAHFLTSLPYLPDPRFFWFCIYRS